MYENLISGNTIVINLNNGEIAMKKDDQEILKEVQKNTRMAVRAIDKIADTVYDDSLSYELSREKLLYSAIHNKAVDRLTKEHADTYHKSAMEDMMLDSGIRMNTLLNNSTSKVAELMIQGSNRGLTSMWKSVNNHKDSCSVSMEVAKELMDFEEKCIERLKKYL